MKDATNLRQTDAQYIHIGLVNNMPDSALEATERQFRSLLCEAESAEGIAVRLFLLALPEITRSGKARTRVDQQYLSIGELLNSHLDGLIVTGAEPVEQKLIQESYWTRLANLIDWAEQNTYSSVWSCLAAHACVLRTASIERCRFPCKLFGVFACAKQCEHPLTAGIGFRFRIPHSRWNDLPEDALTACGYRTLTRLENGSVDIFTKQTKSLFVCFQGHPEYEADSLLLEYRRDIRRFLSRETELYPPMPQGYFTEDAAATLALLQRQVTNGQGEQFGKSFAKQPSWLAVSSVWRPEAVMFYRNWLRCLNERKNMSLKSRTKPILHGLGTAMATGVDSLA